ncbi:MAG: hypothetical protein J6C46_07570 [Clostridia bacterium]|nr:hypothetical protein [Clostridia bacterium]
MIFNHVKHLYNTNNTYHNINHIIDLLNQIDNIKLSQYEYNILCAAICYHDCVYIPGKNDNEIKSIEKFKFDFNRCDESEIVEEIIKSTISFEYKVNLQKNIEITDKLCNIMHDIDYSYFYDFNKLYEADEKIKKEYLTFIDENLFNNGRKKFLNELANKEIYRSIYKKYNNVARANIKKLVKLKYS